MGIFCMEQYKQIYYLYMITQQSGNKNNHQPTAMPQEQSQKIIALSENLIRYSCLQAQQGLYLNAVLILRQASQDIHKRIQQGCLSFQSAEPILKKLQLKQQQYISISKFASPRKFNYDQAPTEPKLLSSSSETTIEDTRIEDSPPKQAASPHKHQ